VTPKDQTCDRNMLGNISKTAGDAI